MATEPDNDVQEQMREWMEAAQRPQAPLSNTELKQVRLLLSRTENRKWLFTQIKTWTPWFITVGTVLFAGLKWIVTAGRLP